MPKVSGESATMNSSPEPKQDTDATPTTTTPRSTTRATADDSTAKTLLALAKDHRYILYCQSLLKQVLEPYVRSENDNHGHESESFWGAALLYATLVVARSNRTLGMEFTGLQHTTTTGRNAGIQRVLGLALLASGWGLFVHHIWKKRHLGDMHDDPRALRGRARRDFHAQQHRAMVRRAALGSTDQLEWESIVSRDEAESPPWHSISLSRLKRLIGRTAQMFLQALQNPPEGPHNVETMEVRPPLSVAKWVLRLHLAHYCLTGRYPTWIHRLLGVCVEPTTDGGGSHSLAQRPLTTRLIGSLIVVQAGALAVKAAAKYLASMSASALTRPGSEQPSPLVFASTPASLLQSTTRMTTNTVCSICRMPRSHHAASSKCGHVFCWKCLYQWVGTVRPECPFCRVECRPQDIMALYHYEPAVA